MVFLKIFSGNLDFEKQQSEYDENMKKKIPSMQIVNSCYGKMVAPAVYTIISESQR